MHPVTEIEIAEVTKIIENAHRYLTNMHLLKNSIFIAKQIT